MERVRGEGAWRGCVERVRGEGAWRGCVERAGTPEWILARPSVAECKC